jgi:hypothetical protein
MPPPAGVDYTVYFMHVAKTAGTSFNAAMLGAFGEDACVIHAEAHWPQLKEGDRTPLEGKSYVAGHLFLPWLTQVAEEEEKPRYRQMIVALVRSPEQQLRSHLRMLARIGSMPREKRNDWPEFIHRISERLHRSELKDADEILAAIRENEPQSLTLFDNCQTRYFSPPEDYRVQPRDVERAISAAEKHLDLITDEQGVQAMVSEICARVGMHPVGVETLNAQPVEQRDALDDPDVMARLSPLIEHDRRLVEALKAFPRFVRPAPESLPDDAGT